MSVFYVYEYARTIRLQSIESVGVELEGGICEDSLRTIKALYGSTGRFSIGSDGSVYVEKPRARDCYWIGNAEIRYWSYSLVDLLTFVETVFDYGFRQNSSCGNHHHFRFRNNELSIMYLTLPETISKYRKMYVRRFGHIEKYKARLNNMYCKMQKGIKDVIENYFERYYAINVKSYFEPQMTLEVRIMPWAENFVEYAEQLLFNVITLEKLLKPLRKTGEITVAVKTKALERALEKAVEEIEKPREREVRRTIVVR
jgi:hypothetical protein